MAYARVQGIGTHTTGTNTVILTLPSTVGSGNFVAGIFTWDSGAGVTFNSCADDKGNTYNISAAVNDTVDGQQSAIFWRGNLTNAPKIITGTFSANPAAAGGTATEWSGVLAASDPKDVAAAGSFNNPSSAGTDGITSPSITTLTDGCMIVGFDNNGTGAGGNSTAGTGYTITDQDTVASVITDIEFKTQSSAGLVQATFTLASGIRHTVWVLAVQPAGGGATLVGPQLNPALPGFTSGHFPRSDSTLLASPLPSNQFNAGWEVQPVQPRALSNNVRAASLAGGDPGIEQPFSQWRNAGLEIQPVQPPNRATNNRKGAILRGDDGTAGILVSTVASAAVGSGFDQFPVYLAPRPTVQQRGSAASGESVFAAFSTNPWTDDLAGHWKRPKFINPALVGDGGITLPSTPVVTKNWGFDNSLPLLMRLRRLDPALAGDQGQQFPLSAWLNSGWEIASPQPPHPRPERSGSLMLGDGGVQTSKINFFPTGFEIAPFQPPHLRVERAGSILRGDDGTAGVQINFFPTGFEAVLHQPSHPRPERAGAWMFGDGGIENTQPVAIVTSGWGFEQFPPYLALWPTVRQRGVILRGDDGTQFQQINFLPTGFEIAPFQPPHLRVERSGSLMRGDDGTAAAQIYFQPTGFESLLHQPSHPRTERSGALALGDIGYYAQTVTVVTSNFGFDAQPWQPPHRQARGGTISRGDDGTAFSAINFLPVGFEALLHQPNHPRPERAGAIMFGDDGIAFPAAAVAVTYNWGFDAQSWQPPRQIYRAATLPWGDDGDQSPFILFRPSGFEIAPFQPPHPRFEQRAAGFLRGDEGNQDILRSWFNAGWEVAPYQPQHVAYARAGAVMFGDDGTQSVYVFVPPAVGTATWRTLMGVGI